jgi:hypothetical protein
MVVLDAVFPNTSVLRNNGNGTFEVSGLPRLVQVAPINGMVVTDANHDGHADVLMTGNDYGNEVFSGRYDACRGIILLGDGSGNFKYTAPSESGFLVDGDGKALARIQSVKGELIVATQNADSIRVFTFVNSAETKTFKPLPSDSRAELAFTDGRKRHVEFYHGSGYLSQSSRSLEIPAGVNRIKVFDYSGKSRVIDFSDLAQAGRN